jgi:hypothetical protein
MSTNYRNTFITVSPDSTVAGANRAPKPGSVAAQQLELLLAAPYTMTSDDLLFKVHALRQGASATDTTSLRAEFENKSRACLRASPLVKTHGWGFHHDEASRVAAVAVDEPAYARLASDPSVKAVPGMRSRKG